MPDSPQSSPIGRRIQIIGPTNAGKTTLGGRLGALLGVPYTDLDALFWKPGWVESTDEEWHPKLQALAEGDGWVVSGNYYRHTLFRLWPRLETVIWLDLPLRVVLPRILRRSWRRWRSGELLWGTNRERFWPQLKVWNEKDSLVGYAIKTRHNVDRRTRYIAAMADSRFAHIHFIRLTSQAEVDAFVGELERARSSPVRSEG